MVKAKKQRETEIIAQTVINNGRQSADIMRMGDIEDGTPVQVLKVREDSAVQKWLSAGIIPDAQAMAAQDYARDFYKARTGSNYAKQTLERIDNASGDPEAIQRAIEQFARVCAALGKIENDVCRYILGEGYSLREYEQRCQNRTWNFNRHEAGGALKSALEKLARFYGHEK